MNEKELIRRALMGDKKAQKECTAKGIMLPCPFCGLPVIIDEDDFYMFCCSECGSGITFAKEDPIGGAVDCTKQESIERWNTRPAPPIGRCGECKCWQRNGSDWGSCSKWYTEDKVQAFMLEDDFCSSFEPREE